MFSSVSLEGIINSKQFKKIQNLGNLALFVQEIMCAKTEVIWRWSKKCPHSGGTIWPVFEKRWIFPPPPNHPNFLVHGDPHVPNMCMKECFGKKLFYNAPLRHRPMFLSVSLEGIINSKEFKKIKNLGNQALFAQEIMCAKIEVIWRWSKKCPHSGGTIKPVFEKGEFFHHLQITPIFLYMVTHMCQTCVWKKVLEKIILQCPLEA